MRKHGKRITIAQCGPEPVLIEMVWECIEREIRRGFTRFGGDLLSHALRRSTIGAKALNGRVRDGTGCFALAMTTKP